MGGEGGGREGVRAANRVSGREGPLIRIGSGQRSEPADEQGQQRSMREVIGVGIRGGRWSLSRGLHSATILPSCGNHEHRGEVAREGGEKMADQEGYCRDSMAADRTDAQVIIVPRVRFAVPHVCAAERGVL